VSGFIHGLARDDSGCRLVGRFEPPNGGIKIRCFEQLVADNIDDSVTAAIRARSDLSLEEIATQSILLECGPCVLTFSYGRKSSNPSWLVSPALIADRLKSSPPWINIISSSAKSFTKPLKRLALQPPEPQTSCRQPHKNGLPADNMLSFTLRLEA
jgi:hypothetical protein